MATGYTGLMLPGVSVNDTKLWNSIMDEVGEAIINEFLPRQGLKWDFAGERFRDLSLRYLLKPSFAGGWIFDDIFGEKGGVFVFGPVSQDSRELKNVIVFCSLPDYAKVRAFLEELNKFVAAKVAEILAAKKQEQITHQSRQHPDPIWTGVEDLRRQRAGL